MRAAAATMAALLFFLVLAQAAPRVGAAQAPGGPLTQYVLEVEVELPPQEAARLGFPTIYMRVVRGSGGNVLTDISPPAALSYRSLLSSIVGWTVEAIEAARQAPATPGGGATVVYVYSDGSRQDVYKCRAPLRVASVEAGWGHASVRYAQAAPRIVFAEGIVVLGDSTRIRFTYTLAYYQGPQPPCGSPASQAARALVGAASLAIVAGAAYSARRRPRLVVVRAPRYL